MASWIVGGSSTYIDDELVIYDTLDNFGEDKEHQDFIFNVSTSTYPTESFSRTSQNIQFGLCEYICFLM